MEHLIIHIKDPSEQDRMRLDDFLSGELTGAEFTYVVQPDKPISYEAVRKHLEDTWGYATPDQIRWYVSKMGEFE